MGICAMPHGIGALCKAKHKQIIKIAVCFNVRINLLLHGRRLSLQERLCAAETIF
jgi:hypothetical protein